ncbi:MAG: helix-turn-helix domain-containing protein [Pseudomonadota bacterium]
MSFLRHMRCPVARAAKVLEGRWTALILREFFLKGPRRYQHLQSALIGIGPNTLAERLKALEAEGILDRELYQQHPPRAEYLLTEKGKALADVLLAMRDWGNKYR